SLSTSCVRTTFMALLVTHVRQEGELAGALDRDRDLALVAPARAADAPGADLALLRDVAAKLVDVLVVDLVHLRLAEEAGLAAPAPGGCGALPRGGAVGLLLCQRTLLRTGCRRRRPRSRHLRPASRRPGRTGCRRRHRRRRRGCRGTARSRRRSRWTRASSRPAPATRATRGGRRSRPAGPSTGTAS